MIWLLIYWLISLIVFLIYACSEVKEKGTLILTWRTLILVILCFPAVITVAWGDILVELWNELDTPINKPSLMYTFLMYTFEPSQYWENCRGKIMIRANTFEDACNLLASEPGGSKMRLTKEDSPTLHTYDWVLTGTAPSEGEPEVASFYYNWAQEQPLERL